MAKKSGLNFYKKRKKINSSVLREIASYGFCVLVSVLLAFMLIYCVGMQTSVIGVSMEPSLYNGQEVMVNRIIYRIMSPKKGDIVVFLPGGNQNAHYYVKRVAAEPGDSVAIKNGVLYINDVPYTDKSLDKIADVGILESDLVLGEDEYFVIGDNINNSEDSRSTHIGPVKKDAMIGKVWFHLASADSGIGFVD